MTVPFWCLLVACLIPIILSWVSGYYRQQQFGAVDNKLPRLQSAKLEGAGARAVAAQQNAWEALQVFTAAVFVAHASGVADAANAALAAQLFIVARVLHAVFYLADKDILRSLAFLVSFGSSIWLFVMAV